MMLAELSTIKTRLELTDAVDDTRLINFIELVSGRFEQFCNRRFERTLNATFEVQGDATEVIPDRFPIESVSSFDLKSNETEGWIAQSGVDYLLRKQSVISLHAPLGTEEQIARITYTGGYVIPGNVAGAGQTALPAEIIQACSEQVAYCYQNRDRLGLISVAGQGGAIQQFAQLDLLPFVKEVLLKYERFIL